MEQNFSDSITNSIKNHLFSLISPNFNSISAPNDEEKRSREFLYECLQTFFKLAEEKSLYTFWNKTDFCGICFLLNPLDEDQGPILPYLMTAYMYNAHCNHAISRFIGQVSRDFPEIQNLFASNEGALYGLYMDKFRSIQSFVSPKGIGKLFTDDGNEATIKAMLNKLAGFFRFYTPKDFETGTPNDYSNLCMECLPNNEGIWENTIVPKQITTRNQLCRSRTRNTSHSTVWLPPPKDYLNSPDGIFYPLRTMKLYHFQINTVYLIIDTWSCAIKTVLKKSEFKDSFHICAPNITQIKELLLPLNSNTSSSNIQSIDSIQPIGNKNIKYQHPPILIPEASQHTSWPITVDLSKLGYDCRSCTIIPVFGDDDNSIFILHKYQSSFNSGKSLPDISITGIGSNIKIKYSFNPKTKKSSDFKKCSFYDESIGKKVPDFTNYDVSVETPDTDTRNNAADSTSHPLPFDTNDCIRTMLGENSYCTCSATLFLFYDLPTDKCTQLLSDINFDNQVSPPVSIEIAKTGLVSITLFPESYRYIDQEQSHMVTCIFDNLIPLVAPESKSIFFSLTYDIPCTVTEAPFLRFSLGQDVVHDKFIQFIIGDYIDTIATTLPLADLPIPEEYCLPPLLIPEASHHSSWPVTIDLSQLGYDFFSCTIIPVFGHNESAIHTLRSHQASFNANKIFPDIVSKPYYSNVKLKFQYNEATKNPYDFPRCSLYDETIGRRIPDFTYASKVAALRATLLNQELPEHRHLPFDTNDCIKLTLFDNFYCTDCAYFFLFYDLPKDKCTQLLSDIDFDKQVTPPVSIEISKTGLVSITLFPESFRHTSPELPHDVAFVVDFPPYLDDSIPFPRETFSSDFFCIKGVGELDSFYRYCWNHSKEDNNHILSLYDYMKGDSCDNNEDSSSCENYLESTQ